MTGVKTPPLSVIEAILLCAVALVPASCGSTNNGKEGDNSLRDPLHFSSDHEH